MLAKTILSYELQKEVSITQHSKSNEGEPKAFLIGTSNTVGINENKLSDQVDVKNVKAFKLDETKDAILKSDMKPGVVILHTLTNEVKNSEPFT